MVTKIHSLKIIVAILFIIAAACTEEKVKSRAYPVVNTYEVTDINDTGATFNGEILDLSDGVVDHGFFYGIAEIDRSTALHLDSVSLGAAKTAGKFSMTVNRHMDYGTTYNMRAFAIGKSGTIVLGQEMKFLSKGSLPPTITGFNKTQGTVGDTLIINGSGFSKVPANNIVTFGIVPASVKKATGESLMVIVPTGIPVGENPITVANGKHQVTASTKFTLLKMQLISFEPSMVTFGDKVIIHGENFPFDFSASSVTLLGQSASVLKATRTTLTCLIKNASSNSTGIDVTAGTQSMSLPGPIKLKAPVITSLSPAAGFRYLPMTINGNNFNPNSSGNIVKFGSMTAQVVSATSTALKVNPPAQIASGEYTVTVTVIDLTGTSPSTFIIY
ncbi:MAG: IPT/TIG domain-containing protein [Bacteroidota bacterium]